MRFRRAASRRQPTTSDGVVAIASSDVRFTNVRFRTQDGLGVNVIQCAEYRTGLHARDVHKTACHAADQMPCSAHDACLAALSHHRGRETIWPAEHDTLPLTQIVNDVALVIAGVS